MSDQEFWSLTLVEYQALIARWQEAEARADRRAAVVAYYTYEGASALAATWSSRRRPRRHPTIDDFLPHSWPHVNPARKPRQTAAEQADILKSFFGFLGATPEGT